MLRCGERINRCGGQARPFGKAQTGIANSGVQTRRVRRLQTAKRTLTGSSGVHVMVEFRWSLYKARTDPGVTRIASAVFTVPSCKLLDMSWKYKTLSL